jgi:cyclopropane fatty-acyl-phospholipid synthase-like methyltransferase
MRTDEKQYSDYLEAKYLPGRSVYLRWIFYPKLFRTFRGMETIFDLGCGTGEFLKECRRRKRDAIGIDSNETLANRCRAQGYNVENDSICELNSLKGRPFRYAVCDNVLEHLEVHEIKRFFERVEALLEPQGTLICVVPGRMGFKKDPTHKTYVSGELLEHLLKANKLKIRRSYYHPFNLPGVDKCLYLNMQVFEIGRATESVVQVSGAADTDSSRLAGTSGQKITMVPFGL